MCNGYTFCVDTNTRNCHITQIFIHAKFSHLFGQFHNGESKPSAMAWCVTILRALLVPRWIKLPNIVHLYCYISTIVVCHPIVQIVFCARLQWTAQQRRRRSSFLFHYPIFKCNIIFWKMLKTNILELLL